MTRLHPFWLVGSLVMVGPAGCSDPGGGSGGTDASTSTGTTMSTGSTTSGPTSTTASSTESSTGVADSSSDGGEVSSGDSSSTGSVQLEPFSFFVTSMVAMQELSGSEDGFGGDFTFGEQGPGAGLRGADLICAAIAERSMPGSSVKQWRAFLSIGADENGQVVHAIDRVGTGPWYDRLGRTVAMTVDDLRNERPTGGEPGLGDDLPNEDGVPNHQPDPLQPEVDNHDTLTGSNPDGTWAGPGSNCDDWTSVAEQPNFRPRIGHSWPRNPDNGRHWISDHDAGGCGPGITIFTEGPPQEGDYTVGAGGGYGGIYCFALEP